MRRLASTVLIFLGSGLVFGAQEFVARFTYPDLAGDFYAAGNLSFPPAAVASDRNIMVYTREDQAEIPVKTVVLGSWPDGSVMNADIMFAANPARKKTYVVSWGADVRRTKSFSEAGVRPVVTFSVAGTPLQSENVDLEVGQINVRVDRSLSLRYYWHAVPIIFLICATCYRAWKVSRRRPGRV